MKKIGSMTIVGFFIIGGLGAVAFSNEIHNVKMMLHFSQLSINEKDNFASVQLEGANSVLMKYNHYMVPTRIETFTFPFGTQIMNISCIPSNIHSEMITEKLQAAPEPITLNQNSIQNNGKTDSNPIASMEWFTSDIGAGIINNKQKIIVKVQLLPVQYQPLKNAITWAEDFEMEIKYKEPEEPIVSANEFDFLVLSPEKYSDELEDLIVHKNNRGLNTKMVTLDDIYQSQYFPVEGRDDPEKVKYFIKHAIEDWGITSVLLVGGSEDFPTRETHVYVKYFDVDEPFVSDLYYADIYDADGSFASWDSNGNDVFAEYDWGDAHVTDQVDLYPDVHIGRLACIDEMEVNTCVHKIITYENSQAYAQDWFTNLVVIGGDTFTDDTWGVSEGEYINQIVMDILSGFVPDLIWDSNGRLSAPAPSGLNEIYDAIDKGCGFIDFSGHGGHSLFATHPNGIEKIWLPKPWGFDTSHISNLANGDKLPIIILGACSTCKFDVNNHCFGWSFISNPQGGGIGSFGVTTFGYVNGKGRKISGGFIEEMTMNTFEAYSERVRDGRVITFGEMWSMALVDYMYPDMEVRDYATLESFQPFGDPTLMVSATSQAPEKPAKPAGPTSIESGAFYSYSSSTIDADGDHLYYLFDWGDGEMSGWLGSYDSDEAVKANHSWENKGCYQVRVKAKDEHGVQSGWSDPLPVRMPKNSNSLEKSRMNGNQEHNGIILMLAFPTEFYEYETNYTFMCPGRGYALWITPEGIHYNTFCGAIIEKDSFFGIANPVIVIGLKVR